MKRAGGVCSCVVFMVVVSVAASPSLAGDMAFIKFEGIDGESLDRAHKDWCDLVSFSHSMNRPGRNDLARTSRRGGSLNMGDIVIVKKLDKASPKLEGAVTRGRTTPKVEIHVVSNGTTYYEYVLTNAVVTSYSISVPGSSTDPPVEEVSLRFEKIKVTYWEFDQAGHSVGKVEFEWSADNS